MNNKLLTRLFLVLVVVVVAIFVLESSLYSVGPGEIAVEVQHSKATASTGRPGLHWKSVSAQLVTLDSRVQIARGTLDADTRNPKQGASAAYAVLWRIKQPLAYYDATGAKDAVTLQKIEDAVEGALRKQLAGNQARAVFAVPPASADAAVAKALEPVADKLGIAVISARVTGATPSEAEQKRIVQSMLQTDTQARRAREKKTRGAAAEKLATTRAQSHAVLAAARQQAAAIRGEGEAQVAGIYAKASAAAPGFFHFYQTLLSERAALSTHTRLYILSTDSPWFKLLGNNPPGPSKQR